MNDISVNLPVIWKWGRRVGFSILDQGLFSGANFILSILLARWLSPEEFGAYAVAFSGFLLGFGLFNSVILDPLMVFGSSKPLTTVNDYLKKMLTLQGLLNSLIFLGLVIIGIFSKGIFKTAFIGMSVFTPLVLTIWFLRSKFYVSSQAGKALVLSIVYSGFLLGSVTILGVNDQLNLINAFICQILAGIFAVILGILLSPEINNKTKQDVINTREFLNETWNYSKWIMATTVADGIAFSLFPPILSSLIGLEVAGAFKAVQNLVNPAQQYFVAVYLLFMPILSKKWGQKDFRNVRKKFSYITLIPILVYGIFISLFPKQILLILYNNSYYNNFSWLVPFFSFFIMILWGRFLLTTLIRVKRSPSGLFYGKLAALGMFLISLIPILLIKSIWIIAASMIIVSLVEFAVLIRHLATQKIQLSRRE